MDPAPANAPPQGQAPATSRVACYARFGAPLDVIEIANLPTPRVEHPEDVLVRVHAGSINPADYKQMAGSMRFLMDRPFPVRPGFDFSGVVASVGADVEREGRIRVGDEVCGMVRGLRTGSTGEWLAVNVHSVSHKPKELTHAEAAAIPLAALTAMQCFERAGLDRARAAENASKSVLITGGPGGVGTFAIQLAKTMFGVGRVVTTASPGDKTELCKSLGADEVLDYRRPDFWRELRATRAASFDVCLDCNENAWDLHALTKPGGWVVSITQCPTQYALSRWVELMGPTPGIALSGAVKFAVLRLPAWVVDGATGARALNSGGVRFDHLITLSRRSDLDPILELAARGKLRVVVDSTFPLADAAQAYERSRSGKAVGKIVVACV